MDSFPEIREMFTHKFGGWREANARRWRNPDGSEGGIVAVSATVHESVTIQISAEVWSGASIGKDASIGDGASIGYHASIGEGASIGDGASIGEDASIGEGDWFFVIGPQGSRTASATAVWSPSHGLRWWVGCQHGLTTERLRERVECSHGASPYGDDYRHAITMVESHPGLARAIAAHQARQTAGA